MAINTLNDIQLIARPFINPDASFSLYELFDGGMTILTFGTLDLLPVMASCAGFHICFAVILTRGMAI